MSETPMTRDERERIRRAIAEDGLLANYARLIRVPDLLDALDAVEAERDAALDGQSLARDWVRVVVSTGNMLLRDAGQTVESETSSAASRRVSIDSTGSG